MRKIRVISLITLILMASLSACNLPEVTPPVSGTEASPTSSIQVAAPTVVPTFVSTAAPETITASTAVQLTNTHKTAVSNVQQMVWSNDNLTLALITQNPDSGGSIFSATLLNSADLTPLSVYVQPSDRIVSIARDGHTAAVLSKDLTTYSLVNLTAGNSVISTKTPGYLVGAVTFSPDLKYIAVTKMDSWEVVLLNFTTGEEIQTLKGFKTAAPVFDAGFNQSLQWIVWHARAKIQLQEVESGKMGAEFNHEDFVSTFALSPDGTILASAAGKTVNNNMVPVITLWDAQSGAEIRTLELANMATAITFSPDGKLLAAAVGSEVQIWDPAAGSLLTTLKGHADSVHNVAFSPDQKTISSAGADNQLYLWQIIP